MGRGWVEREMRGKRIMEEEKVRVNYGRYIGLSRRTIYGGLVVIRSRWMREWNMEMGQK